MGAYLPKTIACLMGYVLAMDFGMACKPTRQAYKASLEWRRNIREWGVGGGNMITFPLFKRHCQPGPALGLGNVSFSFTFFTRLAHSKLHCSCMTLA